MKSLTCAIVILNEFDEILLCHSTGNNHYNLPKGMIDEGETPLEAAIRECREETGLVFTPDQLEIIGTYSYTPVKDIFLTVALVEKNTIDMNALVCESMFERYGKQFPEMDGYMWSPIKDSLRHMPKNLQTVMAKNFGCQ